MAPVIRVYDSVVHVGSEDLAGRIWKWPGSSSSCTPEPVVDVRNTVYRVDREHDGTMAFPSGNYENVTLVWLGGGNFPVPLPAGVTETHDIEVWHAARNAWLARHGCETSDACTNLYGSLSDPPSDDPPPDPGSDDPVPPPSSDAQTVTLTATFDTYLREASPTVANGKRTTVNVNWSDNGGEVQGLLSFDTSQIPAGSTILSATLSLETTGRGHGADFHRMLKGWDEDSTWESMVDGIQADGDDAEVSVDFSTDFVEKGSSSFDVTTSAQAWIDGEANYGWGLLPLGNNGWDFDSREGAVPPTLTVTYEPPL